MSLQRIFLLSSERSGSNLVRRILNRTKEIAGPPAPHLLKAFGPYWPFIKHNSENEERVAQLALELLYDHLSPWDHKISKESLISHLITHGWEFERICDFCYSEYARLEGKVGYMPKENYAFDYGFQLAHRFMDSKFIYLVRDPRDFALSYKKAPGGPKIAWVAAMQWLDEQRKCIQFRAVLSERTHTIRYEDLVQDPENAVKRLFAFLNLSYTPSVLQADEASSETAKKSQYWGNLSKPILSENANKFLQELSKKEIAHIEAVCRPIMLHLGYALHYESEQRAPGRIEQLWLTAKDRFLRRLVYKKRMVDDGELEVRIKRAQIYKEIQKIAGFRE